MFEPLLELYEPRFDCIRYDNRGSGRSDAPLRPTSMPELAHDAVRLLDALGVASAHVYGVSMGGMIAQELAGRHPERVRGLVLGATSPGGPRAVRPALGELAALGGASIGALSRPGRPWLGELLFSLAFRRDQPSARVSCCGTSALIGRAPRGSRRSGGRRSTTTPCRASAGSRRPRS